MIRPSITCNTADIVLLLSFYYMYYVSIVVLEIRPTVMIFNCFIVIIQPMAATWNKPTCRNDSIYQNMLCRVHHMRSDVSSLARYRSTEFKASTQTRELNRGHPMKKWQLGQYIAITWKWCDIGYWLVSFTNRKSNTGFWSIQKSVTLNDPMAVISRYFTQNGSF